MIRRKKPRKSQEPEDVEPKGFDDFDLRLGDTMRGERATMGKSLLDVQRELRIKAAYIAAIENSDPSAFDTPGFIAGYVRSYARYLNMDPDVSFTQFCGESGFTVAHGMSAQASVIKKTESRIGRQKGVVRDPLLSPSTPFIPAKESMFSQVEPRAIGSTLILLALISGIGYGGWTVLRQVQQVQFAPVEQTPTVLSDLDPVNNIPRLDTRSDAGFSAPTVDALDRLYRPQALDVPVMVARDAPISTLDPRTVGSFRQPSLTPQVQVAGAATRSEDLVPRVIEDAAPQLRMVAVRPSWVRVKAADGTVIFEGIMDSGQSYDVPAMEEPPTLRAGESGAIYFALNGKHYGPIGSHGAVTRNLTMSIDLVTENFDVADFNKDEDLRHYAEAQDLTAD
ncbi:MAG: cytoskeletal protein RodZ [Paracoccaceae bacterium]|jgi:cytoskeletal protein RodZ